jgi:uncharacterized membrane protein HdeD (DUF308 family)
LSGFILGKLGAWVVSRSAGWFGFFYLYFGLTNEKHLPHWQVSVLYGLIQLVVGLSMLFSRSLGWLLIIVLLGIYFTAFTAADYFLRSSLTQKAG